MGISVVIPVGPYPANKRWLDEAVASADSQSDDVLLIVDGADIDRFYYTRWKHVRVWRAPWRLGISHAFNFGVMMAQSDLVFMLGSDDTLEPTCLERCLEAYEKRKHVDGYYSVPIRYMDTGEVQTIPCNAAMVTKGLWRKTGGFPIETALGSGDAALLSIMMVHYPELIKHVASAGGHLYNYRRHPGIHTYKLGPWWSIVNETRNKLTELHDPNEVAMWSNNYGGY